MRILSLILALAIAASTVGAEQLRIVPVADENACCKQSGPQQKDDADDCGGACLMTCCRAVTAPADAVVETLDFVGLTARVILPPLLVNDLGEPQSIFHPPRA